MMRHMSTFWFRLIVVYKVLTSKSIIANFRGDKTYMKNISMNQAILFHHEYTNFLNGIISAANEQESAVAEARDILNQK